MILSDITISVEFVAV